MRDPALLRCTCCDKPIPAAVTWLELDQRTWTYHNRGGIPTDKNQGSFPFGPTCAKRKLREHREELADAAAA